MPSPGRASTKYVAMTQGLTLARLPATICSCGTECLPSSSSATWYRDEVEDHSGREVQRHGLRHIREHVHAVQPVIEGDVQHVEHVSASDFLREDAQRFSRECSGENWPFNVRDGRDKGKGRAVDGDPNASPDGTGIQTREAVSSRKSKEAAVTAASDVGRLPVSPPVTRLPQTTRPVPSHAEVQPRPSSRQSQKQKSHLPRPVKSTAKTMQWSGKSYAMINGRWTVQSPAQLDTATNDDNEGTDVAIMEERSMSWSGRSYAMMNGRWVVQGSTLR